MAGTKAEALSLGEGELLTRSLLTDEAVEVGGIFRMDYTSALVLTADKWKFDAGGIPEFAFLLATAMSHADREDAEDDEVLLLRVEGVADLAQERDLLAVREEALRESLVSGRDPEVAEVMFGLDPFTRNRISFTGLRCRILGTFYEEEVDGEIQLSWGSDVDNFYSSSTYRVFKPSGAPLSLIASYVRPQEVARALRVPIGVVRYSSTQRRAAAAGQADSEVKVNLHDFIGQKTGMFGMTRMGKSNAMKTVATRIFILSKEEERPIGQLVLDPQGEYANINTQDSTALAAIGEDNVRIYRFGRAPESATHVRPLGIDFFSLDQVQDVQAMIYEVLSTSGGQSGYMTDFLAASFLPSEDDRSEDVRASRARLLLYGSLIRAGFQPRPSTVFKFSIKRDLRERLNSELSDVSIPTGKGGWTTVAATDLRTVLDWIIAHPHEEKVANFTRDNTAWTATLPIYTTQSTHGGTVRGYRNLFELRQFHNAGAARPVGEEIYGDLVAGMIVIVDLHLGPASVVKRLSEFIVNHLIREQLGAFTADQEPPEIQVVVEEAHNLFERQGFADSTDPWVKLAKEASKLRVGLVYATQEVTGVAHQVLANTKNWVVAHLNNAREVNELSRFYDFDAFADAIVRSEDKGYVRLKTESNPYIVPVQIDLFGPEMINEAREAAGLEASTFDA